jgi:hypothetical protein
MLGHLPASADQVRLREKGIFEHLLENFVG